MQRNGITLVGTMLTDVVKSIDVFPQPGMLCNISSVDRAVGGCVPNTAIDLAKIDPSLPIQAIGGIGNDDNGRFILSKLAEHHIDTAQMVISETIPTGFSDVMSVPGGERTFFYAKGANGTFSPMNVDISKVTGRILHAGYLLLLEQFDALDAQYGTAMARFLHQVQQAGIKTSIDMVSNSTGNFSKVVQPALPYCDYVIINEVECTAIWGLNPRHEDQTLNVEIIRRAMEKTLAAGVKEKVIVHSKEAGFCLSKDGAFAVVSSYRIPSEQIKGSVGAGDAFCAGSLYGIYNGYCDQEILQFASASAGCNLFAANSIDGLRSHDEILKTMSLYQSASLPQL